MPRTIREGIRDTESPVLEEERDVGLEKKPLKDGTRTERLGLSSNHRTQELKEECQSPKSDGQGRRPRARASGPGCAYVLRKAQNAYRKRIPNQTRKIGKRNINKRVLRVNAHIETCDYFYLHPSHGTRPTF